MKIIVLTSLCLLIYFIFLLIILKSRKIEEKIVNTVDFNHNNQGFFLCIEESMYTSDFNLIYSVFKKISQYGEVRLVKFNLTSENSPHWDIVGKMNITSIPSLVELDNENKLSCILDFNKLEDNQWDKKSINKILSNSLRKHVGV